MLLTPKAVGFGARTGDADRLFDHVVDTLALGIVAGRFPEGSQLPNETELDVTMSVSRTAYREAIKYLTAKGLIDAKPRSGTRVRPRSDWNLLDPDILRWTLRSGTTRDFVRSLFELRLCIEPGAARLAAVRRSDSDLADMDVELRRMETLPRFSEASMAADIAFHERIIDAARNPALACLKPVVTATILWSLDVKRPTDFGEFDRALRDHRRIHEAIQARDGERAAAYAVVLISDALTETEAALDRTAAEAGRTSAAPAQ